jgi:phosphoribosylanthranilate isomerase
VDASRGDVTADILELLDRHRVSHLQVYGPVDAVKTLRWQVDGFKMIPVCQVRSGSFPQDVEALLAQSGMPRPAAILLDAFHERLRGGTGQTADWDLLASAHRRGVTKSWPPLILAGGLSPENVADAVSIVRPWAVDVSSGVEQSVGRKDTALMTAFVAKAKGTVES